MEIMTVREFMRLEVDVDVCDNVTDDGLYISFCGPQKLTEAGAKHFARALDLPITLYRDEDGYAESAVVDVDGEKWRGNLRAACDLFESAAGYCSSDDYDKYFTV